MLSNEQTIRDILYQALEEPIGLILATNDVRRCKQALYSVRAKIGDPALARIQIRVSPFPEEGQIVLTKGPEAQAEEPEPDPPSSPLDQTIDELLGD